MAIIIERVSPKNIAQASKLANAIFNDEDVSPSVGLSASFDTEAFHQLNKKRKNRFNWFKYWVAVDTDNKNVVGTIGIYEENADQNQALWLGWFCVDPNYRGRKIGSKLLEFAISQAKRLGTPYLRVYTADSERSLAARYLYRKYSFKPMKRINLEGVDENTLFYQKKLSNR